MIARRFDLDIATTLMPNADLVKYRIDNIVACVGDYRRDLDW
jgi:hypothetical protein